MKKLGKRPGILAFACLGVYLLMFLVGAFGNLSKEAVELVGEMPSTIGILLASLIAFAVKEGSDDDKS